MKCLICENIVEPERKEPHICSNCVYTLVTYPEIMAAIRSIVLKKEDKVLGTLTRTKDACVRRMGAIKILQCDLKQVAKWIKYPCKSPSPAWIIEWLTKRSKMSVADINKEKR